MFETLSRNENHSLIPMGVTVPVLKESLFFPFVINLITSCRCSCEWFAGKLKCLAIDLNSL